MSYINSTTEYWHPFCNKFSKNSGFIEGKGMIGQGASRHSQKGVTLIELVVVMAIIAIMAAFMAPSIGEWAAGFRLRGAGKDLADALQLARLKAISDVVEYKVQINLNNQQVGVWKGNLRQGSTSWPTQEGTTITMPSGVTITNVDGTTAGTIDRIFRPDGTALGTGGFGGVGGTSTSTITLNNSRNDQYLITLSRTGAVRVN
jgi:prepilin-type N-terminal cleavage/methylation domain-containing protein